MSQLENIKSFVCEGPIEILRRLAEKSRLNQSEVRKLPLLKIHLGLSTLVGVLIQFEEDAKGARALIGETDSAGQEIKAITYIEVSKIQALSIQNFMDLSKYLKTNGAETHVGETPPSKLDLNRKTKAISDEITLKLKSKTEVSILWDTCPQSNSEYFALDDLIGAFEKCLMDIAVDEAGQQALASIGEWCIQHVPGGALVLKKESQRILLTVDLEDFDLSEFVNVIKDKTEKLF